MVGGTCSTAKTSAKWAGQSPHKPAMWGHPNTDIIKTRDQPVLRGKLKYIGLFLPLSTKTGLKRISYMFYVLRVLQLCVYVYFFKPVIF